MPVKAILDHFFNIFIGKKTFSRPLLLNFPVFSRPFYFSRVFFSVNFILFRFFHGEKMHFHGHEFDRFCGKVSVLTGYFSQNFHLHQLEFHGHDFLKNFTGKFVFSRGFFLDFTDFFTGTFFYEHNYRFFSRVRFWFSLGKKH